MVEHTHPNKIVPQGRQKNQSQDTLYKLPQRLYLNEPDRPDQLSVGDREALSTMIAAYTFTPRIYDLMRYVAALNSTIQSYLVKRNKYDGYVRIFDDITQEITSARILLDAPQNHGIVAAKLYAVETALRIIAEREGLTQTGASMYDGRVPFVPVTQGTTADDQGDDPYAL